MFVTTGKYFYIITIIALVSCVQNSHKAETNKLLQSDSVTGALTGNKLKLSDKIVEFLWRTDIYDEGLKDTFNSIVINEGFCKTITDPERAALAYVATFIESDCWWDGEVDGDRNNLKCKILTALNLGYQCSDKHLGFLRQWFKDDKKTLEELEDCPTTPNTSTIQETFDEIQLIVKGNTISVFFRAKGVNARDGDTWSWTETDHFQIDDSNIKLINKDKSKVIHQGFKVVE